MNLERGFKRITLVLSIVIGLGTWFLCFVFICDSWDRERSIYSRYKKDYDNISYFWEVWDANGWSGGKRSIVQHFLDSKDYYYFAPFEIGGETVYLNGRAVFPGINRDMLDLRLDSLDEKAKTAKEKALKIAKNDLERHELWGNKELPEIVSLSILAALPAGVMVFLIVWFFFLLLRWLIRGFFSDTHETCK